MIEGYNPRHSEYQIVNFILKPNGRTIYGQYKQCIREIIARISQKNIDEDTKREILIFYDIFLQLKGQMDFTKLKELEEEHWTETFKYRIALEVWVNGRPNMGTIEAALNMPNRSEMLRFIESVSVIRSAKQYIESAQPLEYKPVNKKLEMGDVYNEFRKDGRLIECNDLHPVCERG